MGHFYTAEPDMIPRSKAVHVKAVSGSDIHFFGLQILGSTREIGGPRDLKVALFARYNLDLYTCGACDFDIVGGVAIKSGGSPT